MKKSGSLEEILSPPNGGYGWVVTLIATTNKFISSGIMNSIGILLDIFVQVILIPNTGMLG